MTDAETGFETDRLRLEPLRERHAAEMFDVLRDPRLYLYIPHDPPPDLDAVVTRFRRLETRGTSDERWLNWILRTKTDGACIGRVEATLYPDDRALFAYEVAPDRWGQGFATEACTRVVRALFDEFGATRITAEIDTRNQASIALVERLGFHRAGFKPAADHFKGAPSDEYMYVLESGT